MEVGAVFPIARQKFYKYFEVYQGDFCSISHFSFIYTVILPEPLIYFLWIPGQESLL
jgi:hypothetical protein